MSKYAPLIEHLQAVTQDQVLLGFNDIERLLGESLPSSARNHHAWWISSPPNTSHPWAAAWQAGGWKAKPRFADGTVTFTRFVPTPLLDALVPRTKQTVMALVEAAGIDVEGWKYSNGRLLAQPQSNPAYCYNWSFGNLEDGFVLCVWHQELKEDQSRIVFPCDIGTHTRRLKAELRRPDLTQQQRSRLVQQVERSEAFETAVTTSSYAGKPLKLILNIGETRTADQLADESSKVSERLLDSELWYVHTLESGDGLIVRGVPRADLVEPEDVFETSPSDPGADDSRRIAEILVRRGQSEFRKRLLAAYEGECAVTRTALADLLEAAHIIPHSEGTDYRESNGLLLRADIHTLYDLHHLSVDASGVIHLSQAARKLSAYKNLHGTQLRHTAMLSQAPSPTNLASRHSRFVTREAGRVK